MEREIIYKVAARIFREYGYHGSSIRQISEALGIEKASLYYYIDNKVDLLYHSIETGTSALITGIEEIEQNYPSILPSEKLKHAIENYLTVSIVKHRDAHAVGQIERRFLTEKYQEKYFEKRKLYEIKLRQIIKEGIQAGEFLDMDHKLLTIIILSVLNWTTQWFNCSGEKTLEELADLYNYLLVDRFLMGS